MRECVESVRDRECRDTGEPARELAGFVENGELAARQVISLGRATFIARRVFRAWCVNE